MVQLGIDIKESTTLTFLRSVCSHHDAQPVTRITGGRDEVYDELAIPMVRTSLSTLRSIKEWRVNGLPRPFRMLSQSLETRHYGLI